MHITTADDSSSSLSSSMSETSSILSSISSCCSHDVTNFDSNTDVSGGNSIRTSLQFILNQNQNQNNNSSLDYWYFNNNDNQEEQDFNSEYEDNHHYYYNSYYPDSQEYHHQYSHPSHGKLVPPPPLTPPMEMDLLEDNPILSSDEFNSIFESFTAVVEGHNSNNHLDIEDGCLRGVNCSNGFLDDEQLTKALGAISMI